MWGSLSLASAARPRGRCARYGWAGLAGMAGGGHGHGDPVRRGICKNQWTSRKEGPKAAWQPDTGPGSCHCHLCREAGPEIRLVGPTDEGADVQAAEEMKSITTRDGRPGGGRRDGGGWRGNCVRLCLSLMSCSGTDEFRASLPEWGVVWVS